MLLRGCGQWYRCGRDQVAPPSEQENLDPRPQRNRCRQEDVSKGEPSRGQTGLHSRSSDLTSELQSSVRSDEIVIATEQLQVLIEPLRRASVGKRSSRKVCRALPDGQIQSLDEGGIQCRRVLGVIERFFESPRSSMNGPSFDLDDTIVPTRLEDLAIETSRPEDATDDLFVEIEPIRDDQGKFHEIHLVGDVANERQSVSVASSPDDRRGPEPRPDLDGSEDPARPFLATNERADLIGLELLDGESDDRLAVESTTSVRRPLEPASHGIPGNPLDPSSRGNADTFDS